MDFLSNTSSSSISEKQPLLLNKPARCYAVFSASWGTHHVSIWPGSPFTSLLYIFFFFLPHRFLQIKRASVWDESICGCLLVWGGLFPCWPALHAPPDSLKLFFLPHKSAFYIFMFWVFFFISCDSVWLSTCVPCSADLVVADVFIAAAGEWIVPQGWIKVQKWIELKSTLKHQKQSNLRTILIHFNSEYWNAGWWLEIYSGIAWRGDKTPKILTSGEVACWYFGAKLNYEPFCSHEMTTQTFV